MEIEEDYKAVFTDSVEYSPDLKRAVSVRDGVLIYMGAELGLEPANKEFTVYRSPATIAKASSLMEGIPLTNEHVSFDDEVTDSIGSVVDSAVIDLFGEDTDSRLGVINTLRLEDGAEVALIEGKKQLSLGYEAALRKHDKYDFEQRDIVPHHLAAVLAGRCGQSCAFIDKKPLTTNEVKTMTDKSKGQETTNRVVFLDEDGNPNLEQIAEIATSLPEVLKKLPMDKLSEVMPMLQELVAIAKGAGGMSQEMGDEETVEDEAVKDEKENVKLEDSAAFKDAVSAAIKDHSYISAKAVSLLGQDYVFTDKSADRIMRECLADQHPNTHFADSELRIAFKMLKPKGSDVTNFGDRDPKENRFNQLADKEV